MMKGIGILPGQHISYIDHIVPLCHLMQIPLLVTDTWIKALIECYYPPLEIVLAEPEDYNLDPYLQGYDLFVYVDYFRKATGCFQFKEYYTSHKARSVMSLHGQPDKFGNIYWLEQLQDEDIVLAYGPLLTKLMRSKGIQKKTVVCGNYRLEFYKLFESFFDSKVPFVKQKQSLLYAPTWTSLSRLVEHKINYSPFFDVYRAVFYQFAGDYQLIVKLHPHLVKMMPSQVDAVIHSYPEIYFLQDFPLIYPLLKLSDIYLGDYSSIGYDFLYFDRPLYFLGTTETTLLQAYGQKIDHDGKVSGLVQKEKKYERQLLYTEIFGNSKNLLQLREDIEYACRSPTQ